MCVFFIQNSQGPLGIPVPCKYLEVEARVCTNSQMYLRTESFLFEGASHRVDVSQSTLENTAPELLQCPYQLSRALFQALTPLACSCLYMCGHQSKVCAGLSEG